MRGSRVRAPQVRPLDEANDQGTTLCRAFRILAPQPAQGRIYKGLCPFLQLHATSLLRGLCGASRSVLKHVPPHASLSVSLLQRGRVPPANARKTAFKKILLFLIPAPSFAEETEVCFQAHLPRNKKCGRPSVQNTSSRKEWREAKTR